MVSDDYLIGIGEGLIGLLIIVFCNIVMLAQTAVGEINRNALRSLEDAENKKANRKADKVLKLLENYKRVRITSICGNSRHILDSPVLGRESDKIYFK